MKPKEKKDAIDKRVKELVALGVPEEIAQSLAEKDVDKDIALAQATDENLSLQNKLETAQEEKGLQHPIIEHNGNKYFCVYPKFHYNGKDYTATELQEKRNKPIVDELVGIGFGGFKPHKVKEEK